MSTDTGYRFVDGVLTMQHRYWFANRGWLACECGKPLKDADGRGIHMPEGIAEADATHKRHTDRENGSRSDG